MRDILLWHFNAEAALNYLNNFKKFYIDKLKNFVKEKGFNAVSL
ncbi:hypothetical protein PR249_02065 [Metamycoplasma hyosynoviae]|nr:hypothetical protein [Metamycoplasma hyosynoviae]MDC8901066.1 hypothetical protein [Metamycoplasma hyosynoviae]MDC8913401.1 hypothetical protein [Metamycoplasma hyosynoviae]MDC8914950.1 hypothetical protein [Metamycoplasma hyosynoviae]MDD1358584.1 hypothetical protein [Metamycoplasma hyosynoviae]MDD1361352.1 hypothetical protein [Metamycoplasma hyosynoviae]